jgi:hypothetical protein
MCRSGRDTDLISGDFQWEGIETYESSAGWKMVHKSGLKHINFNDKITIIYAAIQYIS